MPLTLVIVLRRSTQPFAGNEWSLTDAILWSMDYIFRVLNSTNSPSVIDTDLSLSWNLLRRVRPVPRAGLPSPRVEPSFRRVSYST